MPTFRWIFPDDHVFLVVKDNILETILETGNMHVTLRINNFNDKLWHVGLLFSAYI